MSRKIILLFIWISFTAYTLWLAPLDRPYTWFVAQKLLTLQWQELNAVIPALFWLMGIWSMIYGCMMLADGRSQKFRAWTYFVGSNFTGVMCLLPYLIFRQPNHTFAGKKDQVLQIFDQRSTGVVLLITTVILLAYGIGLGDWSDYLTQFHTQAFVHLISLDFCTMALILPITSLVEDDMARRGLKQPAIAWAVMLVPLFGALVYLCLRPPLPERNCSY
jgi:hypothetical protein